MRFFSALCLIVFLFVSPATAQDKIESGMVNDNIMPRDRFWNLIDKTVQADKEQQLVMLREVLGQLSPVEIESFERAFQQEQQRAYTWNLVGASYVINGFAADDDFEYFQRWLISRGRKVFESALANPDSLADSLICVPGEFYAFEEFAYIASRVWQKKTGIDPWKDPEGSFPYTGAPPAGQPSGKPYEKNSSYLSKKYPKLWKKCDRKWWQLFSLFR